MNSQDIAIVAILLACGCVVHIAASSYPSPIVANLAISFYCLAIILAKPNLLEAAAIGLFAGIIFSITSPSINPLGNLISEPVGALACFFIFATLGRFTSHAPGTVTFFATCASGFTFLFVALVMAESDILLNYDDLFSFFIALSPIVLGTALVNSILIGVLSRLVNRLIIFSYFSNA